MNEQTSPLRFAVAQLRALLRKDRQSAAMTRQRQRLEALGLTPRETTVAQLILQQCSYQDIAERCQLAPRTVQFHASNIFRKAYVSRRREFEQLVNGSEPLPPAARATAPAASAASATQPTTPPALAAPATLATPTVAAPPAPIPAPSSPNPTPASSAVAGDPVAVYPKR